MNIRKAEKNDAEIISGFLSDLILIHRNLDPKYYCTEYEISEEFSQWVLSQISSPNSFIFVAEESVGNLRGFISGYVKPLFPWFRIKAVGHISFIYVEEKFRKKGIGSLLEKQASEWFGERNLEYIETYVDEINSEGVISWEKMGYVIFKKFLRKRIPSSPSDGYK